ncbi:unnamed protein product [Lampetra planeri]
MTSHRVPDEADSTSPAGTNQTHHHHYHRRRDCTEGSSRDSTPAMFGTRSGSESAGFEPRERHPPCPVDSRGSSHWASGRDDAEALLLRVHPPPPPSPVP